MLGKITPSQRLKTGLGLGLVFLLIFVTNQVDKKHFNKTQFNLKSIFEDRLVVKGLLYNLKTLTYQEQLSVKDSAQGVYLTQENLQPLLTQYEATTLVPRERKAFAELKTELENYQALPGNAEAKISKIETIHGILDQLAEIQMEEGELLNRTAQKSLDFTGFISRVEVILLIVTGILIQLLIFYPFKK